jgi:hypothetical protein
MRGASKSWFGLASLLMLGACSQLLGLSGYEVDPTLAGSGGTKTLPVGGENDGGSAAGTETGGAGAESGGVAGSSGAAGAGGEAGTPTPPECLTVADCDDTIDCTTDSCDADGKCAHAPNNVLCDATQCEACQAGIGCVGGDKTVTQLLLDPSFDETTHAWDETLSDTPDILPSAQAQSGGTRAVFGPTATLEQQYGDVYQIVTVPDGAVKLTLSGYYKLAAGTKKPADDSTLVAFYALGEVNAFSRFHDWQAKSEATATWKAFSYDTPPKDLAKMSGLDYTFDIVADVWDSVFEFDTLTLNATVCQ